MRDRSRGRSVLPVSPSPLEPPIGGPSLSRRGQTSVTSLVTYRSRHWPRASRDPEVASSVQNVPRPARPAAGQQCFAAVGTRIVPWRQPGDRSIDPPDRLLHRPLRPSPTPMQQGLSSAPSQALFVATWHLRGLPRRNSRPCTGSGAASAPQAVGPPSLIPRRGATPMSAPRRPPSINVRRSRAGGGRRG